MKEKEKEKEKAIQIWSDYGPIFGANDFFVHCDFKSLSSNLG